MYDCLIKLLTGREGPPDEYGDQTETWEESDVFARMKSIGQTEFYQAQTVGIKPELKFVLADYLDYAGQQYLSYDGIRYKILKTYRKEDSNELEITCYGGVRDASTAISDKSQKRRGGIYL